MTDQARVLRWPWVRRSKLDRAMNGWRRYRKKYDVARWKLGIEQSDLREALRQLMRCQNENEQLRAELKQAQEELKSVAERGF